LSFPNAELLLILSATFLSAFFSTFHSKNVDPLWFCENADWPVFEFQLPVHAQRPDAGTKILSMLFGVLHDLRIVRISLKTFKKLSKFGFHLWRKAIPFFCELGVKAENRLVLDLCHQWDSPASAASDRLRRPLRTVSFSSFTSLISMFWPAFIL